MYKSRSAGAAPAQNLRPICSFSEARNYRPLTNHGGYHPSAAASSLGHRTTPGVNSRFSGSPPVFTRRRQEERRWTNEQLDERVERRSMPSENGSEQLPRPWARKPKRSSAACLPPLGLPAGQFVLRKWDGLDELGRTTENGQ